jgi:hypothetical protein
MMRRVAIAGLVLLWTTMPVLAEDRPTGPSEPPVRLKKKAKPAEPPVADPKSESKPKPRPKEDPRNPQDAKSKQPPNPGAGKPDEEPAAEDLEQEAAEKLARVARNMRSSEERLAKKDAGVVTREIQRDILKDLDSLINQRQQSQQQQQNQNQQQQQRSQKEQNARNQQKKQQQQQTASQKPRAGEKPHPSMAQSGTGNRKKSKEELGKIADLYKDIWGHLPETLRQEMDQYSREQFMARYSDLLKQYYATIAEKGRRKGE